MKNYSPVWRDLINFQYKDLNVFSMGPPSSGGICLGQIMKMIEPFSIQKYNHKKFSETITSTEYEKKGKFSIFATITLYIKIEVFHH